jgi:hypothetical protein
MIFEYCKQNENYFDIVPAKNFIPEWYTSIKNNSNKTNVKKCMPFLDSFLLGYMVQSSYDIDFENGKVVSNNIGLREVKSIPTPYDYEEKEYMWRFLYNIKLEDGYSLLVTHPFNRYDLPFITLTGIVDADKMMVHGSLTFFLKNNFSGRIVSGTPIAQLIPIKRDSWSIEYNEQLKNLGQQRYMQSSLSTGLYKNKFWKRKEYK